MNLKDTEALAKRILEDTDLLKKIIRNEMDDGRSLFVKDCYDALRDLMLIAGNNVATADSYWWEMRGRVIRKAIKIKK